MERHAIFLRDWHENSRAIEKRVKGNWRVRCGHCGVTLGALSDGTGDVATELTWRHDGETFFGEFYLSGGLVRVFGSSADDIRRESDVINSEFYNRIPKAEGLAVLVVPADRERLMIECICDLRLRVAELEKRSKGEA